MTSFNGSEDGRSSSPDPGDKATQGRTPLYPVSKATRDLISFLEEGPPPEIQPAAAATVEHCVSYADDQVSQEQPVATHDIEAEPFKGSIVQRSRAVGSASAPSTPPGIISAIFRANKPTSSPRARFETRTPPLYQSFHCANLAACIGPNVS